MKLSLALFALVSSTLAHFELQYPNSLGFNDDDEGQGPCGGVAIPSPLATNVNSTNATVESFAVSLRTGHPQALWLFRATISAQEPYNWTNLLPVVSQTSIGEFCIPNLRAPADFAGRTGMIQVIGSATDGYLYQCAVVNFVSGANTTVGSACTNATSLTATITNQQNLTVNGTSSGTATGSGTGSAASATHSHSAAAAMQNGAFLATAFAVFGAVFML